MLKLLITGGAGFIGSNAVKYFHQKGHEIVVVDKLTYASDPERIPKEIRLYRQDIADVNWYTLLGAENPHVIINFAASSHVDRSIKAQYANEFIKSNIAGVQAIISGIREYQHRKNKTVLLVHISTDEVLGSLSFDYIGSGWNEEVPLHPNNLYSATKASAELLIQAAHRTYGDFGYVICRSTNNYGPHQHWEKFIPTVISSIIKGKSIPIYGEGKNIREWLWVEDFVRGIDLAIKYCENAWLLDVNEIFHFGGYRNMGIKNIDLVKTILKIMNASEDLISFVKDRPGHDKQYCLDWTKAFNKLHWKPAKILKEGLDIVIEDIKARTGKIIELGGR